MALVTFLKMYLEYILSGKTQKSFVSENWKQILVFVQHGITNINNNVRTAYSAWKQDANNAELFTSFVTLLSANKTGFFQYLNNIERISRRYKDVDLAECLFDSVTDKKLSTSNIEELNKLSKELSYDDFMIQRDKMVDTVVKRGGKSIISLSEDDIPDIDI